MSTPKELLGNEGLLSLIRLIYTSIINKVDKVDGKQLSTNDYTDEDKQKLANMNSTSVRIVRW